MGDGRERVSSKGGRRRVAHDQVGRRADRDPPGAGRQAKGARVVAGGQRDDDLRQIAERGKLAHALHDAHRHDARAGRERVGASISEFISFFSKTRVDIISTADNLGSHLERVIEGDDPIRAGGSRWGFEPVVVDESGRPILQAGEAHRLSANCPGMVAEACRTLRRGRSAVARF